MRAILGSVYVPDVEQRHLDVSVVQGNADVDSEGEL